ncbi:MAG: hypothetical protein GXP62_02480 [Oligoflexia bacterium]|nr:hypothetical protein [Oligoflexia bacterium]
MARLVLSRSTPITLAEATALPLRARVDNGAHGGRVELDLPGRDLPVLLDAAFALGAAVPDGILQGHDLPGLTELDLAPTTTDPRQATPSPTAPPTPWDLLEAGPLDPALLAFSDQGLDPDGRERVRTLFHSTDPAQTALACRIATATQWRSFVTSLRRVLNHADTRVRLAAVQGIGAMAGVGMIWQVEKLRQDPSPEIRQAVAQAIAAIESRQR